MQAALTAHERGHKVILCEKSDKLGGVLLCEEKVPFKRHLNEYIQHQKLMISKTDIDLRLKTEVTPAFAAGIGPEALIAALGAQPAVLPVKGIDGPNVLSVQEVYETPELAGRRIVILGGGLAGSELAVYMGDLGHDVTILEMLPRINDGGNILQGQSIGIEFARIGVRLALNTKAVEITAQGVFGERNGERTLYEADTVISAAGMVPLHKAADALRFIAPEFYQIGDCDTPKNITEETRSAYFAALNIGRF